MLSEVDISLNIQSNVNYPVRIDILGNPYNTLDTTNATTEYQWDVTSFTFTNESYVVIQYQINGASSFSSYTAMIPSQNLQGVVDALNGLGIGYFNTYTQGGQTYISTYNDNYTFGQLNIYAPSVINPAFFYGTGFDSPVMAVATQTDGKIVCGGFFTSYNGSPTNYIVRLNTDGSIDNTFLNGLAFGFDAVVSSLAIQTDGKIICGGSFTTYNGTPANYIIRLNSDGTIDPTFVYGLGASGSVLSISVQTDGKIILGGGFASYNGTGANSIIRLNSNGSVDGSFVYGTAFNGSVLSTSVQTDGKILVGGLFTSYNGTGRNRIIRINSDGSVDTSFVIGTGCNQRVYDIAVQTDGKIILAGEFFTYNGTSAPRIVRLNTNGSIDTSFIYGTAFNTDTYSLSIQSDGKILVGGGFITYQSVSAPRIIRLNTDGSIDTSWVYGSGFDNVVRALSLYQGILSVGGDFTSFNGTPANFIIQLST